MVDLCASIECCSRNRDSIPLSICINITQTSFASVPLFCHFDELRTFTSKGGMFMRYVIIVLVMIEERKAIKKLTSSSSSLLRRPLRADENVKFMRY